MFCEKLTLQSRISTFLVAIVYDTKLYLNQNYIILNEYYIFLK